MDFTDIMQCIVYRLHEVMAAVGSNEIIYDPYLGGNINYLQGIIYHWCGAWKMWKHVEKMKYLVSLFVCSSNVSNFLVISHRLSSSILFLKTIYIDAILRIIHYG